MLTSCCFLCAQPIWRAVWGICSYCWSPKGLICSQNSFSRCMHCGLPAENSYTECGRCLQHPPPWDYLLTVDNYNSNISSLVSILKFKKRFEVSYALARLILLQWFTQKQQLSLPKPDLLLPVPLYRTRQWSRGFNQTELLAKNLSRWLNIPWCANVLQRIHATLPQHTLTAVKRKTNLKKAFTVTANNIIGKKVVLVDDVVTTGTTISELSRLLRHSGAKQIGVWTLCRTL